MVPNISEGSIATNLWCDGIFSDGFLTDLLSSVKVKELKLELSARE